MQELLEMIEDLETIQTLVNHPALEDTILEILGKYDQRREAWEADMARQFDLDFMDNVPV